MFSKRIIITILLAGLLVFPLSASMVSFLVIEAGLPHNANAGEYAYLWEGGLMGAFFDAGHVVSNSPVMRLENPPASVLQRGDLPREAQVDFTEAQEGGADFFILAVLEFNSRDGEVRPREVTVRIFNTTTRAIIYEQKFPAGTGNNLQDEFLRAQDTGKIIAAQIR